jgi:RNA polymerase sigma factor (sigma-70 family)
MLEKNYTYFLIRSLKKGDLASLEKLYNFYYSKLYSFAKKFSHTSIDPEDFVHQTFLTVWEKRTQLKEDIIFDKQIFIICKNLIINQLKKNKKILYGFDTSTIEQADADENTQKDADESNKHSRDKIKELNAAIAKLPEKRQEILILHKIENLTYEEIAQFLNVSKKTIANQIYLATLFLKKELNKK